MSDNARLLDIKIMHRLRRFRTKYLDKSVAMIYALKHDSHKRGRT